jgi:hypothetical protein
MHDAFICHASENKLDVARPLAERLRAAGLDIWYDEFSLKLGDSLRESIDHGLADSRFGVVVLSPDFFAKRWPQAELSALFTKDLLGMGVILPVWHNITQSEVASHSPLLADRYAATTADGLARVLEQVLDVIEPDQLHKASAHGVLSLSPAFVRLHTGEWAVKTQLLVVNRSEDPAYAVMIRMLIEGDGVLAQSVEIDAEPQVPTIEERVGGVIVTADRVRLNGADAQGRQMVVFVLHTVGARGSTAISIRGTTAVESSASISIVSVAETPQELLTRRGNEVVRLVQLPEAMSLQGIAFRMRGVNAR